MNDRTVGCPVKLKHFFEVNKDKRIFVCYKNASIGDLSQIHKFCLEYEKILTILMPMVRKYPYDVLSILESDNTSRIYEVDGMAMKSVLKKRGEQYIQQVDGSVLIPDEFLVIK